MSDGGAPYFDDVADGPERCITSWAQTSDDMRIRLGYWPVEGARGTVLILPGRTEYIEKYARVAADIHKAGYAAAAIDWRGQGLSERFGSDPLQHHVIHFHDYQRDLAELLAMLKRQGAPEPFHLLAHSMAGAIGLRALANGWAPATAIFTSPMWGLHMTRFQTIQAAILPTLATLFRQENSSVPGMEKVSHILATAWAENKLTHDREHYEWFVRQLEKHPELQLAAPSMRWLTQTLAELARLSRVDLPEVPTLAFLACEDQIVSNAAIRRMAGRWPSAELVEFPGARHEIFMERPDIRDRALERAARHWMGETA